MDIPFDVPDPRRAPVATPGARVRDLHAAVERRLAESSVQAADAVDAKLVLSLRDWLLENTGEDLEHAVTDAPSPAIARHVLRLLPQAEAQALRGEALAVVPFALPLVVVAAGAAPGVAASLPGTLDDPAGLASALRAHGLLGGSVEFALSAALPGASALALRAVPALVARARGMLHGTGAPLDIEPAPIGLAGAQERAHLRFVLGTAVTAPTHDPLAADPPGSTLMATARLLSAALAHPDATVLALPRGPQRLSAAWPTGFAAQREVALQLFAAAALRELRSRHGEPTAVISAHECPAAPGGGELRVSLSSPFGPRAAEGFRYPLAPWERVPDAVAAIAQLLADCRVADVRGEPAVQPDRDAATGLTRFCRPDDPPRAVH